MPYEIFLALRHLRSRQRRRMARATSLIAVVGITVGVAALIVALALANGFRDEMRDKILRGTAHLTVMRSDGQPISDYQEIAARIAGVPGVVSATGTTYDGAVIVGTRGSAYAVLRGVDVNSLQATSEITRTLVAGSVEHVFQVSSTTDLPAGRFGIRTGDADGSESG